jgi:hypothetical protein
MGDKATTQEFLPFQEIKDGVIILKNKALRGILMLSSSNFALKSNDEQEAIIFQFQNFINSLDFDTQISVQSRRVNLTGYLEKVKTLEENQTNELLRIQTADYRRFVAKIINRGTIMSKRFLVIVPYTLIEVEGSSSFKRLLASKKQEELIPESAFERARTQLRQRMEFVSIGLRRCGLNSSPLTTPELIELLWAWYHPHSAEVGYYPSIMPELTEDVK